MITRGFTIRAPLLLSFKEMFRRLIEKHSDMFSVDNLQGDLVMPVDVQEISDCQIQTNDLPYLKRTSLVLEH